MDGVNLVNPTTTYNIKAGGSYMHGLGDMFSARHGGGRDTHTPHVAGKGSSNFIFVEGHGETIMTPFSTKYAPLPGPLFTDYGLAGYFAR